jgi:hypothetical protein
MDKSGTYATIEDLRLSTVSPMVNSWVVLKLDANQQRAFETDSYFADELEQVQSDPTMWDIVRGAIADFPSAIFKLGR